MNLSEEINRLPKHIRDYIHELESVSPADLVQEVVNLRENQKALLRINIMSDTKCCPYCNSPIGKIKECHPFSSDAGAYFVCTVCDAQFEPDEYEDLKEE